jgi:hypothetical protein
MPYALPPWIHGAESAKYAAEGLNIGVRAAEAAARADIERQRLGEQMMMEKAKMAQAQAQEGLGQQRFLAELALKQKELGFKQASDLVSQGQAQELLNLRTTDAARKFQAQQEYQKAIAGGMNPMEAFARFGPGMGQTSGTAIGAIARGMQLKNRQAGQPSVFDMGDGNKVLLVPQPDGKVVPVRIPGPKQGTTMDAAERQRRTLLYNNFKSQVASANAALARLAPQGMDDPSKNPKATDLDKAKWADYQKLIKQRDDAQKAINGILGLPGGTDMSGGAWKSGDYTVTERGGGGGGGGPETGTDLEGVGYGMDWEAQQQAMDEQALQQQFSQ